MEELTRKDYGRHQPRIKKPQLTSACAVPLSDEHRGAYDGLLLALGTDVTLGVDGRNLEQRLKNTNAGREVLAAMTTHADYVVGTFRTMLRGEPIANDAPYEKLGAALHTLGAYCYRMAH